MKNKILSTAVATALALPTVALGAIDDQGMQYVTAAEGLHGSLRVDILYDTDEDGVDYSTEENSLRLWVNGTSDLGGGLQSTYYWEVRNGEAGDDENTVGTQAYDLGLRGGFGSVSFGYLAMVAFRMVPSASLAFERGSERASPGGDPIRNGIRYESPVINGFQVGVSGVLNGSKSDTEDPTGIAADGTVSNLELFAAANDFDSINDTDNPDGSLDQFSLAAKYTLPIGLEFGIGYESVDFDGYSEYLVNDRPVKKDNASGFRAGVRYGQDNWLLAYEYRTYDGYLGFIEAGDLTPPTFTAAGADAITSADIASALSVPTAAITLSEFSTTALTDDEVYSVGLQGGFSNGDEDLEYDVHAIGAQVKVDRFTFSANYSTETDTVAVDGDDVKIFTAVASSSSPTPDTGVIEIAGTSFEFERDTIAIDAAYSLGSRSTVVLGWKNTDISSDSSAFSTSDSDVDETYLFYRVDF